MHQNNEADALTPDQRRQEIARILARGVLRLHSRAALAVVAEDPAKSKNLPDSDPIRVDVSRETRLHVHPG